MLSYLNRLMIRWRVTVTIQFVRYSKKKGVPLNCVVGFQTSRSYSKNVTLTQSCGQKQCEWIVGWAENIKKSSFVKSHSLSNDKGMVLFEIISQQGSVEKKCLNLQLCKTFHYWWWMMFFFNRYLHPVQWTGQSVSGTLSKNQPRPMF